MIKPLSNLLRRARQRLLFPPQLFKHRHPSPFQRAREPSTGPRPRPHRGPAPILVLARVVFGEHFVIHGGEQRIGGVLKGEWIGGSRRRARGVRDRRRWRRVRPRPRRLRLLSWHRHHPTRRRRRTLTCTVNHHRFFCACFFLNFFATIDAPAWNE